MRFLASLFVFLLIIGSFGVAQNTTNITVNMTANTTNVTAIIIPVLPCDNGGCIQLWGFVAQFVSEGGTRRFLLNDIEIKIEPYDAPSLNETGYFVTYKLPYWYTNNDSFIALPLKIAAGLDQTYINSLEKDNGSLKGQLFFWQMSFALMFLGTLGWIVYNEWYTFREED